MDKISAINSIKPISFNEIQKILSSEKLTDAQKAEFIKNNSKEIKNTLKKEISKTEFLQLMQNRPLIKFRPLKNSLTKKGDKILLAKSLNIKENEINNYIYSIINTNFDIKENITKNNIEKVKTYIYRHGNKSQVIAFLEYELSDVKTTLEKLYKTMQDNSGGLCDYFSRPIHRMDNKTLAKLYNVIDKSLKKSVNEGNLTKEQYNSTAQWALVRIYQIQNNSKLIRACECYKDLVS